MELHLDKGLAQYSWMVWDVLEQSPLFWTAVMGLAHVSIIMMLVLSVPYVSYSSHYWAAVRCSVVLVLAAWTLEHHDNLVKNYPMQFYSQTSLILSIDAPILFKSGFHQTQHKL